GGNEENIPTAPYTRKAPYNYGWDWGPRFVTVGVWRSVRIEPWDTLRIDDFHIAQHKISKDAAELAAEFDIEADAPGSYDLTVAHGSGASDLTQRVTLDAGMNHVAFPFRIANPKLWYPNGYGAQDRYAFTAKVGPISAQRKTGLRSVEL